MMKNNISSAAMAKMINYFGSDVKRINHALKVYSFAKNIGELENMDAAALEILELTAILHDIGIKESLRKYNSSSGNYQELEGPAVARDLLKEFNIEERVLDRICYIIGNHHSYNKIDGIDFQILAEADFLVNIFEDNMESKAIDIIENKYFKTKTGICFLKNMYKVC